MVDSATSVGFIGAGQMATALALGFLRSGRIAPGQMLATDVVPAATKAFTEATGGCIPESNVKLVERSEIVWLAVKPQQMATVLAEIRPALTGKHLVVSIAGGIPLKSLEAGLGPVPRIVRVMPNTPCLVGAAASAYALGQNATASDGMTVRTLLVGVGLALEVPEKLLDAVTGLSGSGPAYVYQIIEALSDGGVRMGLPRDVATKLAAQTVFGAAKMVLETGQHPGPLKDAVTSPGGTTIAGLHELERGGLRGTLMNAVEAATKRSAELGRLG